LARLYKEHQYVRLRRTESHCKAKGISRCSSLLAGAGRFRFAGAALYGESQLPETPMTTANPPSTPIARSKTAALTRVLDMIPRGYRYTTSGRCPVAKLDRLLARFHEKYGIGCSPAQRITRKTKGLANAILVVFWPLAEAERKAALDAVQGDESASDSASDSVAALSSMSPPIRPSTEAPDREAGAGAPTHVDWLLMVTEGSGPVWEEETLRSVEDKRRLQWLGYELVRHPVRGKTSWTWRRPKADMEALYALLAEQANRKHWGAVAESLQRIANQPGFAGIREQSWMLIQEARRRGYQREVPYLYFVQKVKHGEQRAISRRGA